MLPAAEPLMNHSNSFRQSFLIDSLAASRLQHKIRSGFLANRVVAKERKDARPLRHDRLSFITFPALVNLTKSAELPRYILLAQIQ